jgi:hypothetical protein
LVADTADSTTAGAAAAAANDERPRSRGQASHG